MHGIATAGGRRRDLVIDRGTEYYTMVMVAGRAIPCVQRTHDEKGVFNGIVKARAITTLVEDGQSYDAVVERVVMDTAGSELQVITGIRGHSTRVNVEMPKNPPAQYFRIEPTRRPNHFDNGLLACLL